MTRGVGSLAMIAVLALVAAACGDGPMSSICAFELRPTQVRVSTTPVKYKTDFSLSSMQLTEMAAPIAGNIVHGLTRTSMRSMVTVGASGVTNPITGSHCLRPIVDVRLAFDPMTVFITSDQREGTCAFDVTMRHELQHVAVYTEFLDSAAADVERYLKKHFGNRIFYFKSADEAQKKMNDETSQRIGPFVEESMNRVRDLQAPLDTPEEYQALERRCSRP